MVGNLVINRYITCNHPCEPLGQYHGWSVIRLGYAITSEVFMLLFALILEWINNNMPKAADIEIRIVGINSNEYFVDGIDGYFVDEVIHSVTVEISCKATHVDVPLWYNYRNGYEFGKHYAYMTRKAKRMDDKNKFHWPAAGGCNLYHEVMPGDEPEGYTLDHTRVIECNTLTNVILPMDIQLPEREATQQEIEDYLVYKQEFMHSL